MDMEVLSLYLAVMKTRQELVSLGLGEVAHTRAKTRGQRPGITTEEILDRGDMTVSKSVKPARAPTQQETRQMFSIALGNLILETMGNHIYSFNGQIYRQKSGGVIGNILTGALATCYMIVWARKFKEAIERVMVNLTGYLLLLLMIYVDNGNMAARALPLGSRLIKD